MTCQQLRFEAKLRNHGFVCEPTVGEHHCNRCDKLIRADMTWWEQASIESDEWNGYHRNCALGHIRDQEFQGSEIVGGMVCG